MWQKFRKREEPIKIYKDKGEPAPDHLPRTAVDGVISWEPVSMHWNIIVSSSGNDAMLSVTARMSRRERSCKHVFAPPHPTPPHPTPPHLERMPCWVWPQVWRGFWFLNRVDGGCGIVFFWLRNRVFWFRNRLFFGLRNRLFWLRNRPFLVAEAAFLVAEAYMFLVAESPKFGCGSVEIWFWNRNLFDEVSLVCRVWCKINMVLFSRGKAQVANKEPQSSFFTAIQRSKLLLWASLHRVHPMASHCHWRSTMTAAVYSSIDLVFGSKSNNGQDEQQVLTGGSSRRPTLPKPNQSPESL